jgi:hypothetical protein
VHGRGLIAAGRVVLAANAHTKWLLPDGALNISEQYVQDRLTSRRHVLISPSITPFRGHAALVIPPTSASVQAALESTLRWRRDRTL